MQGLHPLVLGDHAVARLLQGLLEFVLGFLVDLFGVFLGEGQDLLL